MLVTLCTLITALTYADAVKVLTQTPAVHTVSPGQEVVLKCNVQTDYDYVSWYKQVPGEAPQFVLRFYHSHSSPSYGTGFSSDRFNSKTTSNIDYQLIIKNAEAGDSAQYFCGGWNNSPRVAVFGPGTKLTVTSSSVPPPVLTVFPPSAAELQSNKATLVCLSSQSGPFAHVTWLSAGSPLSTGISTSTAVQQPDQTFQISSYLSIQTSDWNTDQVYTCKVSVGSHTSEKHINKSACPTEQQ
ncbi:immunoglobulin lambda-1 light chain-like isoform X4 [Sphaeramia orbicularis]|uniref:Immunoglobulin lambda-1 light chain-like n=1 Tax=Sphaeramia orbicularis TaxID=375764 RepID=A0A672YF50_9TELE|nr:immunoglobulin lambda-1 light chain-like isoform X4 [Sphaeramia orbicularis]